MSSKCQTESLCPPLKARRIVKRHPQRIFPNLLPSLCWNHSALWSVFSSLTQPNKLRSLLDRKVAELPNIQVEETILGTESEFAATPSQPRQKLLSTASHPFSSPSTFPGPPPRISVLGICPEAPIKGADIFSYIVGEPSSPTYWIYFSWITENIYIFDHVFHYNILMWGSRCIKIFFYHYLLWIVRATKIYDLLESSNVLHRKTCVLYVWKYRANAGYLLIFLSRLYICMFAVLVTCSVFIWIG